MLIFIKLFIKWECRHGKCIHLHVTILGKWINAYACLVTKDMLVFGGIIKYNFFQLYQSGRWKEQIFKKKAKEKLKLITFLL